MSAKLEQVSEAILRNSISHNCYTLNKLHSSNNLVHTCSNDSFGKQRTYFVFRHWTEKKCNINLEMLVYFEYDLYLIGTRVFLQCY